VVSSLFDHLPIVATKATFPPQPIPSRPPGVTSLPDSSRNDEAWAKQLEQWRVGSEVDGDTVLDLDELSFFLGNYNWCWLYAGEAARFHDPNPNQSLDPAIYNPNLIKVAVKQVGIYAVDVYDFVDRSIFERTVPGGQPLGFWNADEGEEAIETTRLDPEAIVQNFHLCRDAGYYPKMGWCYVTNGVFNRYRNSVKDRGRDFFIYSTVEYLKYSFTFYFNLRTKEEVVLQSPAF